MPDDAGIATEVAEPEPVMVEPPSVSVPFMMPLPVVDPSSTVLLAVVTFPVW